MAALTKTIRNGIGIVGGGPASLWNVHKWNAFKWGEGTLDIGQRIVKLVSSSLSPTTTVGFRITHLISETLAPTTTVGFSVRKIIAESVTAAGDMSSEHLSDAAGYKYLFPDRTTEGESRSFAAWTAAASSTSGWSTAAAAATTWSDA